MAHIGAKNYNKYSDTLAHKRRNKAIFKIVSGAFGGIGFVALVGYFIFYTSYLKITEISFSGLKTVNDSELRSAVNFVSNKEGAGFFAFLTELKNDNILFFNSDAIKEDIMARFPIIKDIEIQKEYFHKIAFNFIERTPIGVWCFGEENSAQCSYFDDDKELWGNALRSTGSLILAVNDYRDLDSKTIDSELFDRVTEISSGLDSLGIKVVKVDIPQDYIGDFKVFTSRSYYLIFNVKENVVDAVSVLKIFLNEKGSGFTPEYIDLRIEGRAYYK